MLLESLQRAQHHRDAALHVRDAGAVQGAVLAGADRPERAVGIEDGVIVAGQHDLDRGFGAQGQLECGSEAQRHFGAVVLNAAGRRGRHTLDRAGQVFDCLFEGRQHAIQTVGVAAARVDVGPADRAFDQVITARRDVVEHDLVLRAYLHAGGP